MLEPKPVQRRFPTGFLCSSRAETKGGWWEGRRMLRPKADDRLQKVKQRAEKKKKAMFSLKEVLKFNLTRESSTTYHTQVPDAFSSCH